MKVTYIGNFRHSWCTEVHIAATLRNLGVQVQEIQEDEMKLNHLVRRTSDSDVLLYTRTWGVSDKPQLIQHFRTLEGMGVKTASYHLDLYLGLKRERGLVGDPFWATQFVFTPDGDPSSQLKFEQMGINHHTIMPGVFKDECVSGTFTPDLASDVCFVGSVAGYHPEWPYRQKLHRFLTRTYGPRYVKHGHPDSLMRGQDLNNLYASVKVVVGDTLCPGFKKPNYWSDRVYETVGRGGFLIHPYIKGMDDEFVDGEHLRFYEYNDFSNLQSLIDYYIDHPDEAKEIAQRGQSLIRDNFTYENRLREAFGVMDLVL